MVSLKGQPMSGLPAPLQPLTQNKVLEGLRPQGPALSMPAKRALLGGKALIAHALRAPHRMMLLEQLAQGERRVGTLAGKVGVTLA